MDDFEKYYNDPDIADEPEPLRQVHAIRLKIADETKDMTPEELAEYYNKCGEEAAKKYGFKRICSVQNGDENEQTIK